MTPRTISHRILVVGVPRSGTTLVQSLLAGHSSLTSFTESHFLSRHYKLLPGGVPPLLTRDPKLRFEEFLAENQAPSGVRQTAMSEMSEVGRGPLKGGRAAARVFFTTLDRMALARGVSGWIEKTPAHLRYLPYIESMELSPTPVFVHVVRRGPDVVPSLHRASRSWERPYALDECAERWNADVAFSLERVGSETDRFVFYEELTDAPAATARRLVESLGLDWQPEILERYGREAESLVTREETWKADTGREIRPSRRRGDGLTPEQAAQVNARVQGDLYDRLLHRVGR